MNARLTLAAVAAAASLFLASSANAQEKPKITDDPESASCKEMCSDLGYNWAMTNQPTSDAECNAANAEFAAGCKQWIKENGEPMAKGQESEDGAPADDSSAPTDEK